jgi:CHASE1-domain containing sensor protein
MAGLSLSRGERRWIGLVPVAVFLVSSALLLSWWQALTAAQGRGMREHFEVDARRVETKIAERFDSYEQILRGTAGLFAASDEVDRQEFRRYVEAIQLGKSYGEVQGIGFALRIPPGKLLAHERSVREEGFPDYRVKPEGARDQYTSVLYLEPFTGRNRRAFGLDGFVEPTRRAAMEMARDLGRPATTRRVTLVQETETDVQSGVIVFFPVYAGGRDPGSEEARRAALEGWVYSPLRMRDLMHQLLGDDLKHVRLEVFDGAGTEPEHLLFDSSPGSVAPAGLSHSISLPMNQQAWTLKFTAGEPYLAAIRQRRPLVEFGFMTLIAFLLTGLSAAAVRSLQARQRAVALSRSGRARPAGATPSSGPRWGSSRWMPRTASSR